MGQWWDAAIAAAGEQPPTDLSAAVAEELIALWSDLGEAMRRAGARSWSVECDGLVVRIVMLSRLHRGDVVAVDTDASAGQRRLPGYLAVGRHRVHRAVPGRDPRREPGPRCEIAGLRRDRAWYARGLRRRDGRSAPGHPRSCRATRPRAQEGEPGPARAGSRPAGHDHGRPGRRGSGSAAGAAAASWMRRRSSAAAAPRAG